MTEGSRHLQYRVGAAVADITPPLEVGFLLSSVEERWAPFQSVRLPLKARAVSISCRGQLAVVVSLDLLGLADAAVGGMDRFKAEIARATGGIVEPDNFVLACTHSHTAPESIALTDLYRGAGFQQWISELAGRIASAIRSASLTARPARMVCAADAAPGLCMHRRIMTTGGVVLSHPAPDPATIIPRVGATDDEVKVIGFLDQHDRPVALLTNAACHPVHEMCMPHVSPDYPGILANMLEARTGGVAVFLNGAAGNLNPPTVSSGPGAAMRHAEKLAGKISELLKDPQPMADASLALAWRSATLPARPANGAPETVHVRIACLRLGDVGLAFLPGEPFVETGLWLQQHSPFGVTLVVGYSDAYIGYLPTDEAFAEGGYETGPGKWSRVLAGSEPVMRQHALELLSELHVRTGEMGPAPVAAALLDAPHLPPRIQRSSTA